MAVPTSVDIYAWNRGTLRHQAVHFPGGGGRKDADGGLYGVIERNCDAARDEIINCLLIIDRTVIGNCRGDRSLKSEEQKNDRDS